MLSPSGRHPELPSAAVSVAAALALIQSPPLEATQVQGRIDQFYPRLKSANAEVQAAREQLRSRRGAFDPVFTFDTAAIRYNSSSNRGKAYATDMTEGVVEVMTRSGISFFAGSRLNLGDVKSPNSSTGTLGEYFVGIKLPLARGNGLNDRSVAERQAKLRVEVAERDVALLRIASLRGGLSAYYQWVGATLKRGIAQRLLEIARTRTEQIRLRVDRQDLPRAELVEIQIEVQRREGELAKADRQLANARYNLNLFLWEESGEPSPLKEAPPTNLPTPLALDGAQSDQWVERALARRPELEAIELSRQSVQLNLDLARNDRKPQLDFVVSPGVDNGRDSIGATSKVGIFYSIPLVQNTVDGRIDEARQRLRQIQLDRDFLVQQVRTQVQDGLNAVQQAYLRYQASQAEVRLAEELERLERVRYDAGDGTLFLLIQRERTRAEAQARLIDVIADYQQAQLDLRAAAADF